MFKGNKVWMAVDDRDVPLVRGGRVLIKYQLEQDYEYWVNPAHIEEIPAGKAATAGKKRRKNSAEKRPGGPDDAAGHSNDAVIIYTDGASSGNPGPAGIGIVMRYGMHEREISRYIGKATNNAAELEAVRTALLALRRTDLPVRIYTDSAYVQGLLISGWKARKNEELVKAIRDLSAGFTDLKIIKIKGHSGIVENERADRLATGAIKKAEGG